MSEQIPTGMISETVKEVWGVSLRPAGCEHCQEVYLISPERPGGTCPVCGSGVLETQPAFLRNESPELVVPYRVERKHLNGILSEFVNQVWLKPDDFNEKTLSERIFPYYLPMWLVDADLHGDWQAEMGFEYQVKSSQESYGQQGWFTREVLEDRIRWEPRVGTIKKHYDNLTTRAIREHDRYQTLIGSFDLSRSKPYQPDMINQSALKIPNLQHEDVWENARIQLDKAAAKDCQKAADAQHVRHFSINSNYENLHWTQLLLPVYSTYYFDDDGNSHVVYINGQTGKIGGPQYASQKKGNCWAAWLGGFGVLTFLLGLLAFLLAAVFPPSMGFGVVCIVLAFLLGIAALVPLINPWQWNRKQREIKVYRKETSIK